MILPIQFRSYYYQYIDPLTKDPLVSSIALGIFSLSICYLLCKKKFQAQRVMPPEVKPLEEKERPPSPALFPDTNYDAEVTPLKEQADALLKELTPENLTDDLERVHSLAMQCIAMHESVSLVPHCIGKIVTNEQELNEFLDHIRNEVLYRTPLESQANVLLKSLSSVDDLEKVEDLAKRCIVLCGKISLMQGNIGKSVENDQELNQFLENIRKDFLYKQKGKPLENQANALLKSLYYAEEFEALNRRSQEKSFTFSSTTRIVPDRKTIKEMAENFSEEPNPKLLSDTEGLENVKELAIQCLAVCGRVWLLTSTSVYQKIINEEELRVFLNKIIIDQIRSAF
ncbi:MAG: hypothetical protein ACK5MA_02995 [Parachlamydiaceae bacterium]